LGLAPNTFGLKCYISFVMKYKQLTQEQRYQIDALLETNISKTDIALIIGVHHSTIYRELKRNTAKRGRTAGKYVARIAQNRTDKRHKSKPKRILLSDELKERIAKLLRVDKWSPELISYRLKKEGEFCVSPERIYQWIWEMKKSNKKKTPSIKIFIRLLNMVKDAEREGMQRIAEVLLPTV